MAIKSKHSLYFFIYSLLFLSLNLVVISDEAITAYEKYSDARNYINQLQANNLPTRPLLDLLAESESLYNENSFNESINISQSILTLGQQIESEKKEIDLLSEKIKLLDYYLDDTTKLRMQLLYIQSDYDSANIELSKSELALLSDDVSKIILNLSRSSKIDLVNFINMSDSKDYSSEIFNSSDFLEVYYNDTLNHYERRDYYNFLLSYKNFDSIKQILQLMNLVEDNINEIEFKKISFNQKNDFIIYFNELVALKEYSNAKESLNEFHIKSETVLLSYHEIQNLTADFERVKSLGVIDNKTIESYNFVISEFSKENFESSKNAAIKTKSMIADLEKQNIIFGGIQRARLKKGFTDFLKENYLTLILLSLILIIIHKPLIKGISLYHYKNKLKTATLEKESITDIQKELQKQYYLDHFIDKKTYHDDFSKSEERKVTLSNNITLYEEKIKNNRNFFIRLKKYLVFKHVK